jgi:predicted protein tyrosine phosphatase
MVDIEAGRRHAGWRGRMKRILFICGKGRQRSPTAELIFASLPGCETDSAGLSADSAALVSSEQLEWATHIAVMERRQMSRLRRAFPKLVAGRKLVSLDIPDDFAFMQPELVAMLQQRAGRII